MTFAYSFHSREQRTTLHPFLRDILDRVLRTDDFKIVEGGRSYDKQLAHFLGGTSKVDPRISPWPHRTRVDGYCWAVDVLPYIQGQPLRTDPFGAIEHAQFAWFLRQVKGVGEAYFAQRELPFRLRFGVDWNGNNTILSDQTFQDWFHIELERA